MAQRVLLMISNNNLALRELYSAVLSNEFPGWRVSFMTAMPERPLEIMAGYTVVIYELGKADDPRRIELVRALGDELRPYQGISLYTHLEGLPPEDAVANLAAHNVQASTGPATWQGLAGDLRRIAATQPASHAPRGQDGAGLLARVQGLLRRDKRGPAPE